MVSWWRGGVAGDRGEVLMVKESCVVALAGDRGEDGGVTVIT